MLSFYHNGASIAKNTRKRKCQADNPFPMLGAGAVVVTVPLTRFVAVNKFIAIESIKEKFNTNG